MSVENSYRKVKTTKSTRDLNQHIRADEDELNMHYPKLFLSATGNELPVKDFRGQLEWRQATMLPIAKELVSPIAAPPTQVNGDVYLLNSGLSSIAIKDILFQSGNQVKYVVDTGASTAAVTVGSFLRVKSAAFTVNNGTFKVVTVTATEITVVNPFRQNNLDDETATSPAVATAAHADWDENGEGDWVQYHSLDDF